MPRSCRSLDSMLVSTVTAISSGIFAKRQQRFARGGHHSRAAGSMDIHHPYAQLSRCGHRAGGGGNIVKLKVQEHLKPADADRGQTAGPAG